MTKEVSKKSMLDTAESALDRANVVVGLAATAITFIRVVQGVWGKDKTETESANTALAEAPTLSRFARVAKATSTVVVLASGARDIFDGIEGVKSSFKPPVAPELSTDTSEDAGGEEPVDEPVEV